MRIFLSGGMHSDWQDRVMAACPQHEYFDPRSHGLQLTSEYSPWNAIHVKMSDLVFAYMEQENPSGVGMALEVGIAVGAGVPVLFVDGLKRDERARYFTPLAVLSNVWFLELEEGIAWLKSFGRTAGPYGTDRLRMMMGGKGLA